MISKMISNVMFVLPSNAFETDLKQPGRMPHVHREFQNKYMGIHEVIDQTYCIFQFKFQMKIKLLDVLIIHLFCN